MEKMDFDILSLPVFSFCCSYDAVYTPIGLAKINYRIHTDAIKEKLIPRQVTKQQTAIVNELICLSNLESLNAVFIDDGLQQKERLVKLKLF